MSDEALVSLRARAERGDWEAVEELFDRLEAAEQKLATAAQNASLSMGREVGWQHRAEAAEAALEAAEREREEARTWFDNEFAGEDDDPDTMSLTEMMQVIRRWGDQAWSMAGAETQRADESNTRLYEKVMRIEAAEARLLAAQQALAVLQEAAIEAEDILNALAKSTPVRRTEGQGVWTFEDDFICSAHAHLAAALAAVGRVPAQEDSE